MENREKVIMISFSFWRIWKLTGTKVKGPWSATEVGPSLVEAGIAEMGTEGARAKCGSGQNVDKMWQ